MKKRILLLVITLLVFMNTPVFAAEITSSIVPQEITHETLQEPTKPPNPSPVKVEQKNIDGSEYLTKTYTVPVDFDPELLIENGSEMDGFLFAHLTTEIKKNEKKQTKEISEPVTVETGSKSMEDILKRLPPTKYYDVDGFVGVLNLDTASIVTEVSGYTAKTSTISTTQTYPGLMYADPSYVPQTAVKDGHTLSLVDVQWVVMGTGLAGDTLVPTEYKATAVYSKKVSNQVPSGYKTTANYKGTVEKTTIDTVTYILTYIGTPIYVPTPAPTPEPVVEPIEIGKPFVFPWAIVGVIIGLLAACGGGWFLFMFLKSKKGVQIYNFIDSEYICLGRQVVDDIKPKIDLNPFKDMIQSNNFTFVIDKPTCKKLFGKNIAVTLEDITMMHMVKGYNEEYRFNLELGGLLDAK